MSDCDREECPDCKGEGGFDSEIKCTGSCDWCGGCVDGVPCDRCEGTGQVDIQCIECGGEIVNTVCIECEADERAEA